MAISEQQRYLFDLRGYIVLEGLLSPQKLTQINGLIDARYRPPERLTPSNCYTDFLHWGAPMLELMIHPQILEWTQELCDELPRLDHCYFYHMRRGEPEPLGMHGSGEQINHSEYFYFKNGKMHNGLIVAAWALNDSGLGDGGFCCVPGSHKANYRYAFDASLYEEPVVQVPVKAGSVVLFTEALTHGPMPWNAPQERRTLFYKYCPAAGSWAPWNPSQWDQARKHIPDDWSQDKRKLLDQLFAPPMVPGVKGHAQ